MQSTALHGPKPVHPFQQYYKRNQYRFIAANIKDMENIDAVYIKYRAQWASATLDVTNPGNREDQAHHDRKKSQRSDLDDLNQHATSGVLSTSMCR